jgi:hypothetical protein
MNGSPKCRSCEAPILWAETIKGRRIPIDRQPAHDGNIRLEDRGRFVPPIAHVLTGQIDTQLTRYRAHFSTCPDAAKHRKK